MGEERSRGVQQGLKKRRRKDKGKNSKLLVHYPNVHDTQGWASQKCQVRSWVPSLPHDGRDAAACAITCFLRDTQ